MAMLYGCPPLRRRRSGYRVVPYHRPPETLRLFAFHEAGHAVLYSALGFYIKYCFATETKGQVGTSWPSAVHAPPKKRSTPLEATQDAACWAAACSFAGIQAEILSHGIRVNGMLQLQDTDTESANEILMKGFFSDDARQAAAGYSQELARAALMHLWPAVEAIAEILIARGEIDNDGVVAALQLVEDVKEIGRFDAMEEMLQWSPEAMAEE